MTLYPFSPSPKLTYMFRGLLVWVSLLCLSAPFVYVSKSPKVPCIAQLCS